MFCPNCGNEIKPGAKFCNGCGQPVVVKNEEDNKSEEIESKEQPVKKSVEKKYTGFIVLLVALGIIFVGLVVAYFTIDSDFFVLGNDTAVSSEDVADFNNEDKLFNGYWMSDYGDVLFRPIANNSTFDGIVVIAYEREVCPYKVEKDGKVTVYAVGSKGYIYYLEIGAIEKDEDGNNFFQAKNVIDDEYITFKNMEEDDDYILLRFNWWADYDYNVESAYEIGDHLFKHWITEEAQRDVRFYNFSYYGDYSEEYNLYVSIDEYGGEDDFNAEESYNEIFRMVPEDNCVYIGDDKYQFLNDAAYLYCEETDHTIYRITDFSFGKIADTDFPPGDFLYVS